MQTKTNTIQLFSLDILNIETSFEVIKEPFSNEHYGLLKVVLQTNLSQKFDKHIFTYFYELTKDKLTQIIKNELIQFVENDENFATYILPQILNPTLKTYKRNNYPESIYLTLKQQKHKVYIIAEFTICDYGNILNAIKQAKIII